MSGPGSASSTASGTAGARSGSSSRCWGSSAHQDLFLSAVVHRLPELHQPSALAARPDCRLSAAGRDAQLDPPAVERAGGDVNRLAAYDTHIQRNRTELVLPPSEVQVEASSPI